MKKSFKLVTKMTSATCADIWCVWNNGENGVVIARIFFPADGQLGDSLECLKAVEACLTKRIRTSV